MKIETAKPRDINGVVLQVGNEVAFNRSGEVRLGFVKDVGYVRYMDYDKEKHNPILNVKVLWDGGEAIIKNPSSIYIIAH